MVNLDARLARLRARQVELLHLQRSLRARRAAMRPGMVWPRPAGRADRLREILEVLRDVDRSLMLVEARLQVWRWRWADDQDTTAEGRTVAALVQGILER